MVNNVLQGTLGQYEILELLGDNGIIQTYRALQTSLGREVAIHVAIPELRHDSIWQEALIRGAEIAAKMEHPNIVPVIDRGKEGDTDYVVVRLMDGGILNTLMETKRFQLREVAAIISQIASALDYVHSQGRYHGDPATVNIIFDSAGNAYIADFYLAGLLEVSPGQSAGVPAFMAPERILALPPTPKTDQYALAAITYTILTGELPFQELAPMRQPERIVKPQEHRPEIPVTVNDVLWKGFAIQPEDRYPTVRDFARDLERVLGSVDQHIFISYSRQNTDYAKLLREDLTQRKLPVWIDDKIEHGDQWFNQINEAIQSCAAFIVVMSPDAENSEWVQKEILLAKRYKKPIYPVLLSGDEFPILIDIQFADVRGGDLPNNEFYRRISRTVLGD